MRHAHPTRLLIGVALLAAAGCLGVMKRVPPSENPTVSELWIAPGDLPSRDLYHGPGGKAHVPKAHAYEFLRADRSGASPGYRVKDPNGREWSVKLGIEAQPEIVVSRVLWAIGYHQPPMHYVSAWTLHGLEAGLKPGGRFRFERPDWKSVGDWSWHQNPFVGTREFGGLIAANLLLNNWDWKKSNNKLYEIASAAPAPRAYVVRDLGAALGRIYPPLLLPLPGFSEWRERRKNNVKAFEARGFVRLDASGKLNFDYPGRYLDILDAVTVADVRWVCGLLDQLSDTQLSDAFRAASYDEPTTARYVRKVRSKIREGLALPER